MWYNYKTDEYEDREMPEDFTDYVPQDPTAQALYKLCLEMGESPARAAYSVLSVGTVTGAADVPADHSKNPYELSAVNTATCPQCGNGSPLALAPLVAAARVVRLPAFFICTNCLYIGQVGVGPVPRTGD